MERLQLKYIIDDLAKKMVFLSGPRQVGKSWLARSIMTRFKHPVYLNYDNATDRRIIVEMTWPGTSDFLVLDEIHKMPGWKNHVKGIYDTKAQTLAMLVTGSARLETFRQGGDSLAGRYFQHRLFPFSPAEAKGAGQSFELADFLNRGGFPEPYLAADDADAGRWRHQYLDGLIREDILSFENVRELRSLSLLVEMLRDRVGSPLSFHSLAEDLSIAPNTVKRHLEVLEALYIIFRVYPHARDVARSLHKQPKVYFFDSGLVRGDNGARLENLVACSLFKRQAFLEDKDGMPRFVRFLRTKEGREVDFVLAEGETPRLMIEVKYGDREVSPHLVYFRERYPMEALQLVADLRLEYDSRGVSVRRAETWLSNLEI